MIDINLEPAQGENGHPRSRVKLLQVTAIGQAGCFHQVHPQVTQGNTDRRHPAVGLHQAIERWLHRSG
jgi:hypothetical protein